MLIPQFSIRWLLGVTAVCAVIFSIVALGVGGTLWAAAVALGLASLVVLMAIYAGLFALTWGIGALVSLRARGRGAPSPFGPKPPPGANPFAAGTAPVKTGGA
jgi:hypothetical protein